VKLLKSNSTENRILILLIHRVRPDFWLFVLQTSKEVKTHNIIFILAA